MITELALSLLGRRMTWRLGRALYQAARGDFANNMLTNGELMVQARVVDAWRRTRAADEPLVVFDIGANVGDWTRQLAERLAGSGDQSADIYLFEPIPATFQELQRRLADVKGPRLHFEPLALSDAEGTATMFSRGDGLGTNSLYASESAESTTITIPLGTAAQFCAARGLGRIHLFKCDAEGHDLPIIRGALPLLQSGAIRVLQFEYNHCWIHSRHYLKDVFDLVEGLPYAVGKVQPQHVEILEAWHPELERYFEANYLLIHHDALAGFSLRRCAVDRFNTLAPVAP